MLSPVKNVSRFTSDFFVQVYYGYMN